MIFSVAKIERAARAIVQEAQRDRDAETRRKIAGYCDAILKECAALKEQATTPPLLDWEEVGCGSPCDDRR